MPTAWEPCPGNVNAARLGGIVGDFTAKLFFEGHHKLDGIETVGAEVMAIAAVMANFSRVENPLLD
jgi:hypothetical protein